jgi:hypothetical protein
VAADEVYGISPFGHMQTRVNPNGVALRAEVTVVGNARVLAYGSVVDNRSGDGVFVPAARVRSGFFPAIHSAGANGTLWRTDLWLSNTGSTSEPVVLSVASTTVPPRGAVVIRDVLGNRDGPPLMVLGATTTSVLMTSRTYNVGSNGTFGQFVPPSTVAIRRGDAPATLIGIESSTAFRTNIGLMALVPATVRLIAYDAAGREVWRSDVPAESLIQLPLPAALPTGRVTAEVIAGSGAVIPYASIVDNVSGDPIYINAQY